MSKKVTFYSHSGVHSLITRQLLKASLSEVWSFFSTPDNLSVITPDKMNFQITSPVIKNGIEQGDIISYKISLNSLIRMNWVTEITHLKEEEFFVDNQRFGPYTFWSHKHSFIKVKDGVMMTDQVTYKLPLGFLGRVFGSALVKKQLEEVFSYRYQKLEEIFN